MFYYTPRGARIYLGEYMNNKINRPVIVRLRVIDPEPNLIKRLRQFKDIRLRQLAVMVGVHYCYLWRVEQGAVKPDDRLMRSIASALDLPVRVVFPK